MKKLFQFRSIQAKIVSWAGMLIVGGFAAIIAVSVIGLIQNAVALTKYQVEAEVDNRTQLVQTQLEEPLDMARTLALSLSASQASPQPLTREQVKIMLRKVMNESPTFLGAWTLWEPKAFDGQDEQYINSPDGVGGQTGRMLVLWSRDDKGGVNLQTVPEEDGADFYQCSKRSNQDCVVDPYYYQAQGTQVVMTSAVAPVIIEGKFVGVVGIDVDLRNLQMWAEAYQSFDNQTELSLITNSGRLAAVKNHAEAAQQSINSKDGAVDPAIQAVLPRLQKGEEFQQDGPQGTTFYRSIAIHGVAPWSVKVFVPVQQIYKTANRLMWQQIGLGTALTLFGLGVLWLLSLQLVSPVRKLTRVAEAVTAGALDVQADIHSTDEVGVLARAFNSMIERLRQMLERERQQRTEQGRTVEIYVQYLNQVAHGNLSQRLDLPESGLETTDPLVILGHNLNNMTANLQGMINQVREASANLTSASSEILAATTQQAAGANEQSAAIAQTTSTVEEVKAITDATAQRAQEVANAAQQTVDVARGGTRSVQDTIQSMSLIREQVESIANNILALSEQTQQIGEIIETVGDLADQSNMLALNASVEAARAGEHGRGFAVVAGEVRSLAEQSRKASEQIKRIIADIQRATNATVMATEEGTKGVERGVGLAQHAQTAILQLAEVINESAQTAAQLLAGSQQQRSGVEQITMAMQNINQTTLQNLSSTRQADHSAQSLNDLATKMNELIRQYQV